MKLKRKFDIQSIPGNPEACLMCFVAGFNSIYMIFVLTGAERVLHLKMQMADELPPLIMEMLDRAENVCIP